MTDYYRTAGAFIGTPQRPYEAEDVRALFDLSSVIEDPKGILTIIVEDDDVIEQSLF